MIMQAALSSVNCGLNEKRSLPKKSMDCFRSRTGKLTNIFRDRFSVMGLSVVEWFRAGCSTRYIDFPGGRNSSVDDVDAEALRAARSRSCCGHAAAAPCAVGLHGLLLADALPVGVVWGHGSFGGIASISLGCGSFTLAEFGSGRERQG